MVIGRLTAVSVAAAAVVAGCSSDPTPIDNFAIKFQLDTEGEFATCRPGVGLPAPLSCSSYKLTCDTRVAIRLLTLPENADDQPTLMKNPSCLLLPWEEGIEDLCDLDQLQFPFFENVRPIVGQVEVTIWPDSPEVENCPMIQYDLVGRPVPDQGPVTPAFGRRVTFDFGGQDEVAEVPLACNAPGSINSSTCEPPEMYDFEVHARNINDLLLPIEEQTAQFLQVRVGQPTLVDPGTAPDDYQIVPAETVELGVAGGSMPFWKEDDVEIDTSWDFTVAEGKDICAIIAEFASVPAATCTTITAEQAAHDEPVSIDGFMVDNDTWVEKIQKAIGLNAVPSDGLILGRVVDHDNQSPMPNVVVAPKTGPLPIIWYINDDLSGIEDGGGVTLTATSTSGYFVALGPPFRTEWNATREGKRVVGTPRAGGLNNRTVTILLIEMAPDFGS